MSTSLQKQDLPDFALKSNFSKADYALAKKNFLYLNSVLDDFTHVQKLLSNTNIYSIRCIRCKEKIFSYSFYRKEYNITERFTCVDFALSHLTRAYRNTVCIPCYYAYRIIPDFDITLEIWEHYSIWGNIYVNNKLLKREISMMRKELKYANR